MKLGIMQPYLYPYLGYFSLIKHTDRWIIFDTIQYIEHGWINRNQIIHPSRPETMYFTVPLQKHSRETIIKDILIDDASGYQNRILGQLTASYKKRAPYFKIVYAMVEDALMQNFSDIVSLNTYTLNQVCTYLGIPFNYEVYSNMNLEILPVHNPGEWALNISIALGADEYINPPGGIDIFNQKKFDSNGIELSFLKINLKPYNQKKPQFFESLSILDAMMFNPPETINKMLDDYTIIKK